MRSDFAVVPEGAPEFEYKPLGTIAYIGHDKAVLDPGPSAPFLRYIRGWLMGLGWKSAEVFMQISYKNMCAPKPILGMGLVFAPATATICVH